LKNRRRHIILDTSYWVNEIGFPKRIKVKKKIPIKYFKNIRKKKYLKYNEFLPLPETQRCVLEGFSPLIPHKKRQSYMTGDTYFNNFANSFKTNRDKFFNQENFLGFLPNGGWESSRRSLLKYTKPIKKDSTWNDIRDTVLRESHSWYIPKFKNEPIAEDIHHIPVNSESYSGLMTSKFISTPKKKSVIFDNQLAIKMYKLVSQKLTVNTSLQTVSGPTKKIISVQKTKEKLINRAILQEESCISQLKQLFFIEHNFSI